jgi:hypothetical protein
MRGVHSSVRIALLLCLAGLGLAPIAWLTTSDARAQAPATRRASRPLAGDITRMNHPQVGSIAREGTELTEHHGQFKANGGRWVFHSIDGTLRLTVLENLALERVTRMNNESDRALDWVIEGTVTEFQGDNFLLLTQARVKNRPPRRGSLSF